MCRALMENEQAYFGVSFDFVKYIITRSQPAIGPTNICLLDIYLIKKLLHFGSILKLKCISLKIIHFVFNYS